MQQVTIQLSKNQPHADLPVHVLHLNMPSWRASMSSLPLTLLFRLPSPSPSSVPFSFHGSFALRLASSSSSPFTIFTISLDAARFP